MADPRSPQECCSPRVLCLKLKYVKGWKQVSFHLKEVNHGAAQLAYPKALTLLCIKSLTYCFLFLVFSSPVSTFLLLHFQYI